MGLLKVGARFGQFRCERLVNAAGLTSRGSLLETTPELFDAHMAVNLRAPFFAMQAAVAAVTDMAGRRAPDTVVNIGSNCAHGGPPHLAPYSAAEAGLAGLTRNAAHAHRWDRIRWDRNVVGGTESLIVRARIRRSSTHTTRASRSTALRQLRIDIHHPFPRGHQRRVDLLGQQGLLVHLVLCCSGGWSGTRGLPETVGNQPNAFTL